MTLLPARELLIMRHGKSDWSTDEPDFSRPLAERGHRDSERMARWIADEGLEPELVVTSPAARAAATARYVIDRLAIDDSRVLSSAELYLGSLCAWLEALDGRTERRILVCGHNPGLDDLVTYLASSAPPRTSEGKLMTTAAIARFEFKDDWDALGKGSGRLVQLVRARELP